jgi:hypothetical protein
MMLTELVLDAADLVFMAGLALGFTVGVSVSKRGKYERNAARNKPPPAF